MSKIQIFVKGLGNKTILIKIHSDALTDELFRIIEIKEGIPVKEQRLIYAGKQLEIGKRLTEYGVIKDSTIFLVLRLLGGSKEVDDGVETTFEPDMITMDDDPDDPRVKMPCGHGITPTSLTQYARSLLDAGKHVFYCPYIDRTSDTICMQPWDYITIRRSAVLTNDEQQEFEQKITKNYLLKAQGIQECPKCHSYCERMNPVERRVICSYCTKQDKKTYEFCWSCLHTWISQNSVDKCGNPSCSGEDPRLTILKTAPKKMVVGVPVLSVRACNGCGILIEHVKACKHMKCRMCGYSFCFICLKQQVNGVWPCGTFNSKCTPAPVQTSIVGT